MADGIPIFLKIVKLEAPHTFPTFINAGLVCRIPVYALITQGTNAEKNTINAFAFNPNPIQIIVIGIQDTGGMGRKISKTGPLKWYKNKD